MKKQNKLYYGIWSVLAICLFAGIFFAFPMKAEAASFETFSIYYRNEKHKIGNYEIWFEDTSVGIYVSASGSTKLLVTPSEGHTIGTSFMSDGSTLYYTEGYFSDPFSYFYEVKLDGTGLTYLGKIESNNINFTTYYNGNVYFNAGMKKNWNVYQLNPNTKTIVPFLKGMKMGTTLYNQNVIVTGRKGYGDVTAPRKCYIFNFATGKKIKISNKACGASFASGKVYFVERINSSSVRIKSCNLSGKKKKTVAKSLPITSAAIIGKITSKYVYYNANIVKYYRYNYKTKKSKKIKEKQYVHSEF